MPWNEKDYPASMKNLDSIVRRKAIDIANAMVKEGYEEDRAIPISISQAKEWVEDADKGAKRELKDKDITNHKNDPKDTSSRLQDKDVEVRYDREEEMWMVITEGAKRADSKHKTKKQAQERAKEIAENKGVKVRSYKKTE
nr:DUF2188 domain-containing protein [Tissierella sp.]